MDKELIYREELLDRLSQKTNNGVLSKPDIEAKLTNPLCGDEIKIQIKTRNNQVEQALYSGSGCAISQVSASLLTEKIEGKKLSEVKKITENDILNLIGINPGPSRLKCAVLSLEVLKKAIDEQS